MMAKTILLAVFVAFVVVAKVHGKCTCITRDIDPVCGTDGTRYENPSCLKPCAGINEKGMVCYGVLIQTRIILKRDISLQNSI